MPERSTTRSTNSQPSRPSAPSTGSAAPVASASTPNAASTAASAPTATPDPLSLTVRVTPHVHSMLAWLLATGLYGRTAEDVAGRLIDEGLRRAMAEGLIPRR